MTYTPLKGWRTMQESDTPGAVSLTIVSDTEPVMYHVSAMLYIDEDWHMILLKLPELDTAEMICGAVCAAIKALYPMSEADMNNVSQWVIDQRGA